MRLATYDDGTIDGQLVVVSRDLQRAVDARAISPNLLTAIRSWPSVEAPLRVLNDRFDDGRADDIMPFDPAHCLAPLPRAPQWCDGSAFLNHGRLMDLAFDKPPIPDFDTIPVMYQGASDDFLGSLADVPFMTEVDGIDFEGEFGVIVDEVAMATSPAECGRHVRLLVQINDWSLRTIGAREVRTGFGFL